jgi:hypothetical protein
MNQQAVVSLQNIGKHAELLGHQGKGRGITGKLGLTVRNHAKHEQAIDPNRRVEGIVNTKGLLLIEEVN